MAGPGRAVRRFDRHVLPGQRQVRRLRRGLRLLRAVEVRRGRHADARDDGARADPRARPCGRGRGAHRFCMVTQGQGLSKRDFEKVLEGARLVAEHTNLKRCVSIGHMSVERAHALQRGRHPARPPQRRDGASRTTPRSRRRSATRAAADDRRRPRGWARDVRRRDPQPRRDARAAGRDGLPARRDRPHQRADQPVQSRARGRSSATAT